MCVGGRFHASRSLNVLLDTGTATYSVCTGQELHANISLGIITSMPRSGRAWRLSRLPNSWGQSMPELILRVPWVRRTQSTVAKLVRQIEMGHVRLYCRGPSLALDVAMFVRGKSGTYARAWMTDWIRVTLSHYAT